MVQKMDISPLIPVFYRLRECDKHLHTVPNEYIKLSIFVFDRYKLVH